MKKTTARVLLIWLCIFAHPSSADTNYVLPQDDFSIQGVYRWTFRLGPFKQVSTHIFHPNHIDYAMNGNVYATQYKMQKIAYQSKDKKWIGKDNHGTVYVLFFDKITDQTLKIYKHKCKKGLNEAIHFKRPALTETKDHGWNTYTRYDVKEQVDTLPFSGVYIKPNSKQTTISITDAHITWHNKTYTKITHHLGERRWVGQSGRDYLLVFYKTTADNELDLHIKSVQSLEQAYKTKHSHEAFEHFVKK